MSKYDLEQKRIAEIKACARKTSKIFSKDIIKPYITAFEIEA